MPVRVRRDGPLPIARQIADQLVALIRGGTLRPGDRLPPVRVLAGLPANVASCVAFGDGGQVEAVLEDDVGNADKA